MVTVLMAILLFLGIGWQFAFEQWGLFFNANGLSTITYPIALSSKPLAIIPIEGDPSGWNTSNGIAIAGGDIKTASNTQANILSKWVLNGSAVEQGGQSVIVLIIGGLNSGQLIHLHKAQLRRDKAEL